MECRATLGPPAMQRPAELPERAETRGRLYFGHLIRRADSLEKTLMLGKIEGRRGRGQQRMRWLDRFQ